MVVFGYEKSMEFGNPAEFCIALETCVPTFTLTMEDKTQSGR